MTTNFTITEGDNRLGGRELILHGGERGGWAVGIKFPSGTVREFCKRCGGTGEHSFNLMDGTVCYGCMGRGLGDSTTEADIIRRAVNREKAAAKRAEKADKEFQAKKAAMDAWQAAHADLLAALLPYLPAEGDWAEDFLPSLAVQAHRSVKPLTERQVEAVLRAVEQDRQRAAERAQANAEQISAGHFAQESAKVSVTVEIVNVKFIASERWDRSSSYLVTMKTAEGHVLKTFNSGEFGRNAEKGQTVTIKGIVKSHDEYDGLPQTMLTRVTKIS